MGSGGFPSLGNIFSGIANVGSGGQSGGGGGSSAPSLPQTPAPTSNVLTNPLATAPAAMGQGTSHGGTQSGTGQPQQTFTPATPSIPPASAYNPPIQNPPPDASTAYQTGTPTKQTYVPPNPNDFYSPTPGVAQTPSGLPPNITTMGLPPQQQTAPVAAAPITPPPAEPAATPPAAPSGNIPRPPANVGPQPPPQDMHLGPLQPLFDLLTKGPQAFIQDLQGLNQQAGGAYTRPQQPQYTSQGYTSGGYGYGDTSQPSQQPGTAPPQPPSTPTATRPAPGWAGQAVRAGFDRASQDEARQRQTTGRGPPGSQEPASPSGGPPEDTPSVGNVKYSVDYIGSHGGFSETGYHQTRGAYGGYKVNPEFSNRLTAAGQAYERETGIPPKYGLGDRDTETQRYFWEDSQHGRRYAAAPPGQSLHQSGLAMDMPADGSFTAWLRNGNARRFGLGFPVPHDPYHVQMQDLRGAAYPYTPSPPDIRSAGAQASLTPAGEGVIPGSQLPAGTRPGDKFYNPGDYARAVFGIESGGNPYAITGSNRGLGQFGPQEERMYGITPQNRANPAAQFSALQREAQDHSQVLRKDLGRDPEAWELYLTHQQGRAGGPALLMADGNTPAWQAIRKFYGSDAIAQRAIHGNIPRTNPLANVPASQVTAEQFRNLWRDRFNRDYPQQVAPQQTPTIAPGTQAGLHPTMLALSENAMRSADPNRFPLTEEERRRGSERGRERRTLDREQLRRMRETGPSFGPSELFEPERKGNIPGGKRGQLDQLIQQLGLA